MRVADLGVGLAGICCILAIGAVDVGLARADMVEAPAIVLPPVPEAEVTIDSRREPPPLLGGSISIRAPLVSEVELATALAARMDAARKEPLPARWPAAVKRQIDSIAAMYANRQFKPLWFVGGNWSPSAMSAAARLKLAGEDGLDISNTPVPELASEDVAEIARTEVALSLAAAHYAWQASGGRVDPKAIGKLITETPHIPETSAVLERLAASADAGEELRAFNPPQAGYAALREKLSGLRADAANSPSRIPLGPIVKVGMRDPRVPALRARLGVDLEQGADEQVFDSKLAAATAIFQRTNGLLANGQLSPNTVIALSRLDPASMEAEVIANMERWRWEPRALSPNQVEVNIPDFTVTVTLGGELVHRARVIVGQPAKPTPVFSNRMQFIEVNPYWNVPESIIKNEMMPRLAKDPTYLTRMGYEVKTLPNGKMIVRQPPGERNALGRIKFMFPNEHAVYLHDTPSRGLFAATRRAFSHGCVRVDQPMKFAEVVLGKENGWTEDRVKRMIGGRNQTIPLPRQLDIHIEYFTTFVNDAGELQFREDIYGYSSRVRSALGLG